MFLIMASAAVTFAAIPWMRETYRRQFNLALPRAAMGPI